MPAASPRSRPGPSGKRYAVALSHDVDNPRYIVGSHVRTLLTSIRRGDGFGLRHALHKLAGTAVVRTRDGFAAPTGFRAMLERELELGLRSTTFVSGLHRRAGYAEPNDPAYDIGDGFLEDSLRLAREHGFPIGMHAAIATAPVAQRYHEQKARVERALGAGVRSNRHHYWNISRADTADALEAMSAAGLEFDSSISFYASANFRRSVAWPFVPYHPGRRAPVDLLELPATCMDAWAGTATAHVLGHLDAVRDLQGLAVLNWHANRFNNRYYAAQGDTYLEVVRHLREQEDAGSHRWRT